MPPPSPSKLGLSQPYNAASAPEFLELGGGTGDDDAVGGRSSALRCGIGPHGGNMLAKCAPVLGPGRGISATVAAET